MHWSIAICNAFFFNYRIYALEKYFILDRKFSSKYIVGSVLDKHSYILKRTGKKNGFL